jgi:hypothetical protein
MRRFLIPTILAAAAFFVGAAATNDHAQPSGPIPWCPPVCPSK